jgi:hypothetical protein
MLTIHFYARILLYNVYCVCGGGGGGERLSSVCSLVGTSGTVVFVTYRDAGGLQPVYCTFKYGKGRTLISDITKTSQIPLKSGMYKSRAPNHRGY